MTSFFPQAYARQAGDLSYGKQSLSLPLGNGDDPANNLYWAAMYGVKTYLKRSNHWKLTGTMKTPGDDILERCVFLHSSGKAILIADAYQGSKIKQATLDFLADAGGASGVDLVAYVGHNGLMDFSLEEDAVKRKKAGTQAVVLACKSKSFFLSALNKLGARPAILTTGLMAPEAYTLEAILEGWIKGESGNQIHERAATAYNKYQKCGMNGARRLFSWE